MGCGPGYNGAAAPTGIRVRSPPLTSHFPHALTTTPERPRAKGPAPALWRIARWEGEFAGAAAHIGKVAQGTTSPRAPPKSQARRRVQNCARRIPVWGPP
ncbi:unnamed protein product [Caretta caretta]